MERYIPAPAAGDTIQDLARYVMEELYKVSASLDSIYDLDVTFMAPERPREGMIRIADGTNWNPGAGGGLYEYKSGAWVKL